MIIEYELMFMVCKPVENAHEDEDIHQIDHTYMLGCKEDYIDHTRDLDNITCAYGRTPCPYTE